MITQTLAAQPLWLSGLLVVALPTLIAMSLTFLVRRSVGLESLVTNNEVAGFKFAVVGVIYAVLLGFAVIVVWEKFHDADAAATQEAGALVGLYRLSDGLFHHHEGPGRDAAVAGVRATLSDYLRATVNEEWPAMSRGRRSPLVGPKLGAIYAILLSDQTQHESDAPVLSEMYHQLDEVTQARRERLTLAQGIVPDVVWVALATGGLVTIGYTLFFGVRNLLAQALMTGALCLLICLGLQTILAIDHPFTGPISVQAEPLIVVLEEFGGG